MILPYANLPGGSAPTGGAGTLLYYHCYVINSAGNKWTHVRIDPYNVNGWIYVDNHNGTTHKC